jgi:O-antigen ligase
LTGDVSVAATSTLSSAGDKIDKSIALLSLFRKFLRSAGHPMFARNHQRHFSNLKLAIGLAGSLLGLAVGFLAGVQPFYPALGMGAVVVVLCLFTNFEVTVLGLLILRGALDPFTAQQLPAAFAIGTIVLTLLYVVAMALTKQPIYTDGFWWFFAGWTVVQGLWVMLLPLGLLGMDGSFWPESLREWLRLCSWVMVYLLVMQLKATTSPQRVISCLFWSLLMPLTVAALQLIAPSVLPPIFSGVTEAGIAPIGEISRVNGTLGLANTFATFCLLFLLLTWWQIGQVKRRWPWLLLLGALVLFIVSTKSLFVLLMMAIAMLVLMAPRLKSIELLGGIAILTIAIGLFASSDAGRERLASLSDTPLLNPDLDVSRAVLLSATDNNSFNWRIAQWTYLLQAWQQYPMLGYGLLTCSKLTVLHNYAHNEYVRALTEGGIVGLIAFIGFLGVQIGRLLYLAHRAPPGSAQRNFCWTLLAMLLATIVGMITENIWTHTTLFFYWWTLMAIAGWDWQESSQSEGVVEQRQLEVYL